MKKAFISIVALIILFIILLLGTYFLNFILVESKISESHALATKTYYLAEAALNEAIWKLKNDSVWENEFETNSVWESEIISRSSALFPNGSYQFQVKNISEAYGEIISIANFSISEGKSTQRIVKTKVFKAIGSPLADYTIFTGGPSENIYIKSTDPLNIHNGSIFSNNNINIKFWSVINVDNKALANNNINTSFTSELNSLAKCSKNICEGDCAEGCSPEQIFMPSLDFNFYLQEAKDNDCSLVRSDGETNCYFSSSEKFEKMLWDNYPGITLDGVIYVDGNINIRAAQELTINGVLASGENKDINIGEDNCWVRSEWPFVHCGSCKLTINRLGIDEPSGILAQKKINAGGWFGFGTQALYVNGLVYAGDEMKFSGVGAAIEIHGGVAVRKFTLSSMWNGVDIWLDPDVIIDTFKSSIYSSVITVEHWEESY